MQKQDVDAFLTGELAEESKNLTARAFIVYKEVIRMTVDGKHGAYDRQGRSFFSYER
jgi:hypothetical protein